MKNNFKRAVVALLTNLVILGSVVDVFSQENQSTNNPTLDPVFARFVKIKQEQARKYDKNQAVAAPEETWKFFGAILNNDTQQVDTLDAKLGEMSGRFGGRNPHSGLKGKIWQTISETTGAYTLFQMWESNWLHRYATGIIESIPRGSVYLGGTDPGRYLVTVLSESQLEGKPFFTITQNQLADPAHLEYLREIYGGKITITSEADSQKCTEVYMMDAQRRYQHDKDPALKSEPRQMRPGEIIREFGDGRFSIAGHASVMTLNGLLAKNMFENNPEREFYLEESFPLDWMFPHLTPNNLILKINRKPLDKLSDETVKKDREFWNRYCGQLIGNWLDYGTTVSDLCAFAERVHLKKDLAGFKGDIKFAQNQEMQWTFAKLRSSQAGLYAWRVGLLKDIPTPDQYLAKASNEREGMTKEVDFAFRQAFALGPTSLEAVVRYAHFLISTGRIDDAILIAYTSLKINPSNSAVESLVESLRAIKAASGK